MAARLFCCMPCWAACPSAFRPAWSVPVRPLAICRLLHAWPQLCCLGAPPHTPHPTPTQPPPPRWRTGCGLRAAGCLPSACEPRHLLPPCARLSCRRAGRACMGHSLCVTASPATLPADGHRRWLLPSLAHPPPSLTHLLTALQTRLQHPGLPAPLCGHHGHYGLCRQRRGAHGEEERQGVAAVGTTRAPATGFLQSAGRLCPGPPPCSMRLLLLLVHTGCEHASRSSFDA